MVPPPKDLMEEIMKQLATLRKVAGTARPNHPVMVDASMDLTKRDPFGSIAVNDLMGLNRLTQHYDNIMSEQSAAINARQAQRQKRHMLENLGASVEKEPKVSEIYAQFKPRFDKLAEMKSQEITKPGSTKNLPLPAMIAGLGLQGWEGTTPQEPPPPESILSQIINAINAPSRKVGESAAKMMREMGTAQKDAWKKFLSNPTAENSVDIAGDLIVPMALSTKASQFADTFTDNLYSRLNSSIMSGPVKATGKRWLDHFMKGTNKGEVDFSGLKQMLEQAPDRVFTKEEITNQYFKNPLLLTIDEYPTKDYRSWWPRTPGVGVDLDTYKMNNITSGAPWTKDTEQKLAMLNQEIERRSQASTNAATPEDAAYWQNALRRAIGEYNYTTTQPDLAYSTTHSPVPNTIVHTRLAQGEHQGRPITVLGEIQSDVHQPRSKIPSYLDRDGKPKPEITAALEEERNRALGDLLRFRESGQNSTELEYQLSEKFNDADHTWRSYKQGIFTPPDLPFKEMSDWAELGLKNALFHAAKAGSEGIVIPTGKAVSAAVGMPEGGQIFYDKDLPNKLIKYLKNQLGVEVPMERLAQSATDKQIYGMVKPKFAGSYAAPKQNAFGPIPPSFDMFLSNVGYNVPDTEYQIPFNAATSGLMHLNNIAETYIKNNRYPQVMADALKTDLDLAAQAAPFISQPTGTFIPLPQEARDKILSDGQRLWALLAAAGIPTFLQTQKKNDPKRSKPSGS